MMMVADLLTCQVQLVINKADAKSFGKDIAFNLIYVEQHSSVQFIVNYWNV